MKKNRLESSTLAGLVCAAALLMPVSGYCGDKFVESDDYKDKDFKKCIISDYENLEEGDDIEWEWIAEDVKFTDSKLNLRKVENKAPKQKKSVTEATKTHFKSALDDVKSGKGQTLNVDVCIYETEDYNVGKAWIPFAGGHQMQAGIGVEMVITDKKNNTVAKFRHFARQGARVEDAAHEAAEDLAEFLSEH